MHIPVMLEAVLASLRVNADGRYVDATLGLGGHAEAIAQKLGDGGALLGLDVDPDNIASAQERLSPLNKKIFYKRANFSQIPEVLDQVKWTGVDGILVDLGISSPQLDNPERGFSFSKSGPLDMRLDPTSPIRATDVLARKSDDQLEEIFRTFGETRFARKLARLIKARFSEGLIQSTGDLALVCERAVGFRRGKSHPATRVFLALRATVNQELEVLGKFLQQAPMRLNVGGRLAVISFHSAEDRIVKESFRGWVKQENKKMGFGLVSKKPIPPSFAEIKQNPRARSAKLRVLERIQ